MTAVGATLAAAAGATGADGTAAIAFTAGEADNRFDVSARVPDTTLHAFAPTTGEAQRVAVPGLVDVHGTASFTAQRPGRVVVRKTGDATPFLPVTGARFRIGTPDADGDDSAPPPVEVTVGPDGTTPPVERAPGRYVIREVEPPPGYEPLDPWIIDVPAGDTVTVEVANRARPGRLVLRKVGPDGTPLAGAIFRIDHDTDLDGSYDALGDDIAVEGVATIDHVRPGHYLVTERQAPVGYEVAPPRPVIVQPGETLDVVIVDEQIPVSTTTTTMATTTTTAAASSTSTSTSTSTSQPSTVASTTSTIAAPTGRAPRLPTTGVPLAALAAGAIALVAVGRALVRVSRR
jgi:uncharacterized surface anchored protein